jgi:hypothetical protein
MSEDAVPRHLLKMWMLLRSWKKQSASGWLQRVCHLGGIRLLFCLDPLVCWWYMVHAEIRHSAATRHMWSFRGKIGQTSHFRGFQDSLVGFSAEVLGVTRQDPDFPKGQKLQKMNWASSTIFITKKRKMPTLFSF